MSDFKKQYDRELKYQEEKSNKYTLNGVVMLIALELVVWALNAIGIFEIDRRTITVAVIISIILLIPIVFMIMKEDTSKECYKYIGLTLICTATGVMCALLSYHAVLLYVIPLLFAAHYRQKKILWFTSLINSVSVFLSMTLGFYYGICDLNILFEGSHKRDWYINVLESGTGYVFNSNPLFVIIVFGVIPRCMILLAITFILQDIVVGGSEDAARIAQLTYMKETDSRTKVFNKNKYEEMVLTYYPYIDNIRVIFWDMNNLKMINDTYGHEYGDKAIERLSSVLYSFSDDRRRVYRIGGDEFVMIIDNPGEYEGKEISISAADMIEKANAGSNLKITSAVGMAKGYGRDVLEVVKRADESMYKNKVKTKAGRVG
jgi:diguanylate cyclase (GGDEF)-like protein